MNILFVQSLFIGTTELILIGGIALLLFGGKKLPEMMRGLGKGMSEFKKGMNEPDKPEGEEGQQSSGNEPEPAPEEEKENDGKDESKEQPA